MRAPRLPRPWGMRGRPRQAGSGDQRAVSGVCGEDGAEAAVGAQAAEQAAQGVEVEAQGGAVAEAGGEAALERAEAGGAGEDDHGVSQAGVLQAGGLRVGA